MMGDPLRGDAIGIAIIGAGMMGRQHAAATTRLAGARLVGVCAAHEEQGRDLAQAHGVRFFRDAAEVLACDEIDAVTIATPTDTHVELAVASLQAGRHVFVEKPLARTLEDALAAIDAARAADRVLAVGHVIRYFPEYRAIGEAIERGDVGRVAVATFGRRCQWPDWAPDGWHTDSSRSGGVVLDMMIHDIDLVRWYFGEPDRVLARCIGPDRHGGLDYALATLHVPGGPICHLHASWAEPEGFSQQAEVCGSEGMLCYDSRTTGDLRVALHGATADVTALPPPPPDRTDPFLAQLADWTAAIRGERALVNDGEWALRSLNVALAMLESSDRREPVEVADPMLVGGAS